MKERFVRKRGLRFIMAIGLVVLLILIGCGTKPKLPVEGKVVEFGNFTPLTGAVSFSEQMGLKGIEDYVRYFNEEIGIPGVTIKHSWIDIGLSVSMALSAYSRFVERDIPVLYTSYSTALEPLKPKLGSVTLG